MITEVEESNGYIGYHPNPPPYFVWDILEAPMRVVDRVKNTVVFIGVVNNGIFTPLGTGFFLLLEDEGFNFQHIVTARHVIEEIVSDKIYIRSNLKSGGMELFETKKSDWFFHESPPKNQFVDVAVMPAHAPIEKFDIQHISIPLEMITPEVIEKEQIGIGDEICIIGLFTNHYGSARNIAVTRCGTIAAMREEPMRTQYGYMDGYLIEAHSIGGMSGSPVFVQMAPIRAIEGKLAPSMHLSHYFLGLICGHWTVENPEDAISDTDKKESTSRINTGMGIVIPADRILEIMNGPQLKKSRKLIVELNKKRLAKDFSFDSVKQNNSDNQTHREDFNNLLDAAVKGRP